MFFTLDKEKFFPMSAVDEYKIHDGDVSYVLTLVVNGKEQKDVIPKNDLEAVVLLHSFLNHAKPNYNEHEKKLVDIIEKLKHDKKQ